MKLEKKRLKRAFWVSFSFHIPLFSLFFILFSSFSLFTLGIGIAGLYGLDGSTNATGDDVKKLDIIANDTMIEALRHSKTIGLMVSEENPEPIIIEPEFRGLNAVIKNQ